MKLTFKMSGGFAYIPALSKPLDIDTAQIDPQIASQLQSLVQEACCFDQPAIANIPTKAAAHYRTYTITVEDGLRAYTIKLTDPITDENLERLVSFLEGMARQSTSNS